MKDKCPITLKYHFVLNIMLPSLLHLQYNVIDSIDPQHLLSWTELGQVNLSTSIMIDDEVYNMEYLLVLRIENLRPFRRTANSLEDGCLPRIGAANDEYAKVRGAASKIAHSSLLSFYVLCSLRFNIGTRHLSLRCLRWWKW